MAKTHVPELANYPSDRFSPGQGVELCGDYYTIVGRARSGGFGDVYFVRSAADNAVRAMKVFCLDGGEFNERPEIVAEIVEKYRRLFIAEARNIARMSKSHPENFPRFYGAGDYHGQPYYLMEKLSAVGRKDISGFDSDEKRKKYVCDLCDAVSALHKSGLVHFDIKPENILKRKSSDGNVKYVLGDFGSVHCKESHSSKQNPNSMNLLSDGRRLMARTTGYKDEMDDRHTVHADIYAIGKVIRDMFEMDVPALWGRIILKCISNNFKYRYASVAELKEDVKLMERRGPAMLTKALSELMGVGGTAWQTDRNWIYVSAAAKGKGKGTKDAPYRNIELGIAAAKNDDVVCVLPGEYVENLVIKGKKIRLIAKDGAKKTTIRARDRFRSVVTLADGAGESLVEGFTITGGNGNPAKSSYGFDYYGGGFNCSVSCMIRDCMIVKNGQGEPKKTACTFGGGLHVTQATVQVVNCLIADNFAWASGGAILANGQGGAVILDSCTVRDNDAIPWAFGHQGGLSLANSGVMSVSRSLVYGNGGDQIGAFGAVHANGTRAQVERSYVEGGAKANNISLFLPRPDNFKTLQDASGICGCSFDSVG